MPQKTGSELADRIRSLRPNLQVLLATGYADLSEAEQFELNALQGVLNKPYTIRVLESLLARVEADVPWYPEEVSLANVT